MTKYYLVGYSGKEPRTYDSIKKDCVDCKKNVWIEPFDQTILKKEKLDIVCTECEKQRLEKRKQVKNNGDMKE